MPALPSEVSDSYFWNQPYSRAAPYVTGENPTAERIADPWGCGGGRFYNTTHPVLGPTVLGPTDQTVLRQAPQSHVGTHPYIASLCSFTTIGRR